MSSWNVLRWLRIPSPKTPYRRRPQRRPTVRLCLEHLEARLAPATFQVNPGDVSNVGSGTTGGFVYAINQANALGGSNTIVLASGSTYTFSTANNFWYGPDALPAISSAVTINGNGAVLQRDPSLPQTTAGGLRFFYVSGGLSGLSAGSLTLNNLTLEGGYAKGGNSLYGGGGLGAGGAVFNQGTLILDGVTLTGNVARGGDSGFAAGSDGGGGIGQDAPSNSSGGGFGGAFPGGVGGAGGGASFAGGGGGGGFSANGSSGYKAGGPGGGLSGLGGDGGTGGFNAGFGGGPGGDGGGGGTGGGPGGDFGNGGSGSGGGTGGVAGGGGGGVGGGGGLGGGGGGFGGGGGSSGGGGSAGGFGYVGGEGGFGGGGGSAGGGGNSEFSGAGGGGGFGGGDGSSGLGGGGGGAGLGGAVFSMYGSVTVYNSTFTANSADGGNGATDAGSGFGYGGAIFNLDGSVSVTNATLAGDSVSSDGGELYNLAYGNLPDGTTVSAAATIVNSILANSIGGTSDLVNNTDAAHASGTATVNLTGPNLIRTSSNSGTGSISGTTALTADPKLDVLENNGGQTQTRALLAGSPAIGAGVVYTTPTFDQRGAARPVGSPSDIGAFETTATPTYAAAVFAGQGVYRFVDTGAANAATADWTQLSGADASVVAVDAEGDVAALFLPGGHNVNANAVGVWRFKDSTGWLQLSGSPATDVAIVGPGYVVATFSAAAVGAAAAGVWRFEDATSWDHLNVKDQYSSAASVPPAIVAQARTSSASTAPTTSWPRSRPRASGPTSIPATPGCS